MGAPEDVLLAAVGGGTDLAWHGSTIGNDILTMAVNTLYAWDSETSPTMTFPASPSDGDRVGIKAVSPTAGSNAEVGHNGDDIEMPDGSLLTTGTQLFGAVYMIVIWRYRSLTGIWHLDVAHAIDAGAISVGGA